MDRTIIASPLENEFWPLEGLFFEGSGPASVSCTIHGDPVYKGYVELRLLGGFDVTVTPVCCPEALTGIAIQGDMEAINNSLVGAGVVFTKDFDKKENLQVRAEGHGQCHTYTVVLR